MYYDKRNKENLMKLADHTKVAALNWYAYCLGVGADILIYETIRTEEQQRENVRKGASQTMRSYHLKGQALDFVPVDKNGKTLWGGYDDPVIKKVINKAKSLGFEWGGEWDFVDKPHLQFKHKGYGTDTFGKLNFNIGVIEVSDYKMTDAQKRAVARLAKHGIVEPDFQITNSDQKMMISTLDNLVEKIKKGEIK